MRAMTFLLAMLLMSIPACASAGEPQPAAGTDPRFPVQVNPEEAVRQKAEMRSNLVALRETLTKLADKDFPGAENALRRLAHTGPVASRPGVSTKVFRDLETEFEASVDKTIEAARSRNTEVVLRSLSDTMAFCQSCHMAFRQSPEHAPGVDSAKPRS